MKTRFRAWEYGLTFTIGALIAWQGVPSEFKKTIPGLALVEIGASVLLGGFYALEKMRQHPTAEKKEPE